MGYTLGFTWTPDRIDQLTSFVGQMSCAQMAAKLGCGRNAVIGKIHRLGLSNGVPPEVRRERAQRAAQKRAARRHRPEKREPDYKPIPGNEATDLPAEAFAVTLMELDAHMCRWPSGDGPFLFCGAHKTWGSSYCSKHSRMSYAAPRSLKPYYFYNGDGHRSIRSARGK